MSYGAASKEAGEMTVPEKTFGPTRRQLSGEAG
jgi:hypothetical protein